jgi:transposase-like protein
MANVLNTDKQIAVISALAEGSSIRSIERMKGVHRDTIMRLGVKVGKGCAMLMDSKMQDLDCRYLQFDELWGFIGKKERHVRVDDSPEMGDVWTYCAIDAETKLVPTFRVGKRNRATTVAFVQDVPAGCETGCRFLPMPCMDTWKLSSSHSAQTWTTGRS